MWFWLPGKPPGRGKESPRGLILSKRVMSHRQAGKNCLCELVILAYLVIKLWPGSSSPCGSGPSSWCGASVEGRAGARGGHRMRDAVLPRHLGEHLARCARLSHVRRHLGGHADGPADKKGGRREESDTQTQRILRSEPLRGQGHSRVSFQFGCHLRN